MLHSILDRSSNGRSKNGNVWLLMRISVILIDGSPVCSYLVMRCRYYVLIEKKKRMNVYGRVARRMRLDLLDTITGVFPCPGLTL